MATPIQRQINKTTGVTRSKNRAGKKIAKAARRKSRGGQGG